MKKLDELEALLRDATPGPWTYEERTGWAYPSPPVVKTDWKDGWLDTTIIRPKGDNPGDISCTVGKYEFELANAKAIAALRNNAEALIAVARAAAAFIAAEAREAETRHRSLSQMTKADIDDQRQRLASKWSSLMALRNALDRLETDQ